jgi:hypothetical protein
MLANHLAELYRLVCLNMLDPTKGYNNNII